LNEILNIRKITGKAIRFLPVDISPSAIGFFEIVLYWFSTAQNV